MDLQHGEGTCSRYLRSSLRGEGRGSARPPTWPFRHEEKRGAGRRVHNMSPESPESPSRNMGINWDSRGPAVAKNRGCKEAYQGPPGYDDC